jgi:hypothetical protein
MKNIHKARLARAVASRIANKLITLAPTSKSNRTLPFATSKSSNKLRVHASNNVAKTLLEFSRIILRSELRSSTDTLLSPSSPPPQSAGVRSVTPARGGSDVQEQSHVAAELDDPSAV